MNVDFDVVVLGGGPAGLFAALRLTDAGWNVAVVTQSRRGSIEGFSPRVAVAIEKAGCTRSLDVLGRPVERLVFWGDRPSTANHEYIIDRARFDDALACDARNAGVSVMPGRVVETLRDEHKWSVTFVESGAAPRTVSAKFLVEARGRAYRKRYGTTHRGPATVALSRVWRTRRANGAFSAVSTFPNGWGWFATTGNGTALLSLMIAGHRGSVPGRGTLDHFYSALVRELKEAKTWLADAVPIGPASARIATSTLTLPVVEDGQIVLGDAALTIDPLSGHGCYEAIRAAFTMPALINTLVRGNDRALAEQFHTERLQESFGRHARMGRELYAMETKWRDHPFWAERRTWPAHDERDVSSMLDGKVVMRPVIENDLIVSREVVVTSDHPLGVWRVGDIPIVSLMKGQLSSHEPHAAAADEWLKQHGLLETRATTEKVRALEH